MILLRSAIISASTISICRFFISIVLLLSVNVKQNFDKVLFCVTLSKKGEL